MTGLIDMHCHLLYGVDDGPEQYEETMELLQKEYNDGVRMIYLTPHYRKNMFETSTDIILEHFEVLKEKANQVFPELEIRLGSEIHVNTDIGEEIRNGRCFTLSDSKFVLLEFSEESDGKYLIEQCNTLMNQGFGVIIAHVERCSAIRKNIALLKKLVHMGVYVQMNAGSITGDEGLAIKWFCKKVMKWNLLHFVGSDAHNLTSRKPNMSRCSEYMERIMGENYRNQIMIRNSQEIIERSL